MVLPSGLFSMDDYGCSVAPAARLGASASDTLNADAIAAIPRATRPTETCRGI